MASRFRWYKVFVLGLNLTLCGLMGTAVADNERFEHGRKIFVEQAQPSCSLCHSLRDAGAAGAIGPDLDQLQPSTNQVIAAVLSGVGVMPTFAGTLNTEQIEAVAYYVNRVAGPKPR